jgi:heat-inducible transcriptional repressor
MVRNVDYEARRRAVLAQAIRRYIKDAIPVASEDIARDFSLSSATIRNIFVELEEDGFLTHPYTSAGRIPTVRGYRYYVDSLISGLELLEEEKEQIIKEYKRQINRLDSKKRLEEILEEASEVISSITHYAGIVSFLDLEDRFFYFYKGISSILEQPEFHDFGRLRILIRILEDKRYLLDIINRDFKEKVKIYFAEELNRNDINKYALVVSRYRIKDRPSGRLAVLGPMRMEYKHIIPTMEFMSDALTEVLEKIQ